jgi:uncharacterized membrane protein
MNTFNSNQPIAHPTIQIGTALVKTGELSVAAAKALVEYDQKTQVTAKFWQWVRKELLKEK